MIRTFRHKGLARLFERDDRSKVRPDLAGRIAELLATLDSASDVRGMDRPSYRLHPLKGNLKGHWAATVRANWRITFRFYEGDAYDVDLIDYH